MLVLSNILSHLNQTTLFMTVSTGNISLYHTKLTKGTKVKTSIRLNKYK